MSEHTPGPWAGRFNGHFWRVCDAKDLPVALGAASNTVFCDCRFAPVRMPDSESAANARLIAAAPDLLDVLQALLSSLDDDDEANVTGMFSSETHALIGRGRRAVRRATGRT